MIKAIIFDCFGVLSTEGFRVFCDKYFSNSPDKRAAAKDLMDRSCLGNMSFDEFESGLAALGETSVETVREYLNRNKPNEPLFKLIRDELRPKYKIGMLSNSSANWLDELFTPEDINLFDDIILSYEVRVTKPDPRIYRLGAARRRVEPKQSVLVDDVKRYVEGAEAVGMQAIWYRDFEQMKTGLEKILSAGADD